MATLYWLGDADAVAQVSSASIDSVDATPANNTFHVTIGDEVISQVGTTDAATTAAALVALLNASTHPYFSGITWTNPSGGTITGTADTAGVPFVAALTETGAGTGAVTDFSDDTASAGPADLSTAENWSTGSLPTAGDTIIFDRLGSSVAYNLDALSGVGTLAHVQIRQSFTGEIGLRHSYFATTAAASTYSTTRATEYREQYLRLAASRVTIGGHAGPGAPVGSTMIKVRNTLAGANILNVDNTAAASAETGVPAVMYLAAHADADVYVRAAPGGVGIGMGEPDETATIGDVHLVDGILSIGRGVTWTSLTQYDGTAKVTAAATVSAITIRGGDVHTDGDFALTAATIDGAGALHVGHRNSGGAEIGTCTANGGTLDCQVSAEAMTISALAVSAGATVRLGAHVTVTGLTLGTGYYSLAVS